MNYSKIYYSIIEKAKRLEIERNISNLYFENHHILPKCMGGNDDLTNLAKLTPEEHFVCHLLLIRMYPEVYGLYLSIQIMIGNGKYKKRNKEYGAIKRKITNSKKELGMPLETRMKISESRKGIIFSVEQKEKMSAAKKGKTWEEIFGEDRAYSLRYERSQKRTPLPDSVRSKISNSKKGISPHNWTDESKNRVSQSMLGKEKSEEHKNKLKEYHSIEKICPYCNKSGTGPSMQRWHFKNCKKKIC